MLCNCCFDRKISILIKLCCVYPLPCFTLVGMCEKENGKSFSKKNSKTKKKENMKTDVLRFSKMVLAAVVLLSFLGGCSSTYYSAMEKVGVHKRDIMVDRVEAAQESQKEAQEEFASALEQFDSVVKLEDTDLNRAYEKLNGEYEDIKDAAADVSTRIDSIQDVAYALFDEWQEELELYKSDSLRRSSKQKMDKTRTRYKSMMASMERAEKSMEPVLATFQDNVLFLKHNLNAQAIGSLKGEFTNLKSDINELIEQMNSAIQSSDTFIEGLQ